MGESEQFNSIILDFTKDLEGTFPELSERFHTINFDEYHAFCMKVYPSKFFDILYENEDIFDEPCELLPGVDFSLLMKDEDLSDSSKKTIWKYLQLVLFCTCNESDEMENFGNASLLFQAISEDDLQKKIAETMSEMKHIFTDASFGDVSGGAFEQMFEDISGNLGEGMKEMFDNMEDASGSDSSGNGFSSFLDPDKMGDHLSSLMNGKIGSMAKEIAEEATKEFQNDKGEFDQEEVMKQLLKNPGKIMNLVKNIGGKLEEKLKSGEYKESELMEEAQELMGKMKDMPGVKQMMASMGLGGAGGKMDFKGMASRMQQSMKEAKMKEGMRAKLEKRNKEREEQKKREAAMSNLTQQSEDTFVWTDENSNPSTPLKKSSKRPAQQQKKKKKGKKKK